MLLPLVSVEALVAKNLQDIPVHFLEFKKPPLRPQCVGPPERARHAERGDPVEDFGELQGEIVHALRALSLGTEQLLQSGAPALLVEQF